LLLWGCESDGVLLQNAFRGWAMNQAKQRQSSVLGKTLLRWGCENDGLSEVGQMSTRGRK